MRIRLIFAWYDFWVGVYWDRAKRTIYILPLPMLGFQISFFWGHRCVLFIPNHHGVNRITDPQMICHVCGKERQTA